MTQWEVAALQPPHLTAMIPWEGLLDSYRDAA
jgi:predicted acyl esterase